LRRDERKKDRIGKGNVKRKCGSWKSLFSASLCEAAIEEREEGIDIKGGELGAEMVEAVRTRRSFSPAPPD